MHDQRMVGGAPLQREDLGDRPAVGHVGAEAVDGLGRKGDDFALKQAARRVLDRPAHLPTFAAFLRIHGSMFAMLKVPRSRCPIIHLSTAMGLARRRQPFTRRKTSDRREGDALVTVDEWMIHREALEQRRRLLDDVLVVAALGPEERRLEGAGIAQPVCPAEPLDQHALHDHDLDGREVDGHLASSR